MKADNVLKIFLVCLFIAVGPWVFIYFFYREMVKEMIFMGVNSPVLYLVLAIVLIVLIILKIRSKEFSFGELFFSITIASVSSVGSVSLGHGIFTNIIDTEVWHGEAVSLEYTPRYETSSTDSDGDKTCTSHGPYYNIVTNMKAKNGRLNKTEALLIEINKNQFKNILNHWDGDKYIGKGGFLGKDFHVDEWLKGESVGDIGCLRTHKRILNIPDGFDYRFPVSVEQKFVNYLRTSRSSIGITASNEKFIGRIPKHHELKVNFLDFGKIENNLVLFDIKMKPSQELVFWADSVNILLREQMMSFGPITACNPFVFITDQSVEIEGTARKEWGQLKKNDCGILLSIPDNDLSLDMFRVMTLSKNTEFVARLEYDLKEYVVNSNLPDASTFTMMFVNNLIGNGAGSKTGFDRLHEDQMRYLFKDINLPIWQRIIVALICLGFLTPMLIFFHKN